jgi:hypothetical protein
LSLKKLKSQQVFVQFPDEYSSQRRKDLSIYNIYMSQMTSQYRILETPRRRPNVGRWEMMACCPL